jgi:hypothetical protein
MNWTPEQYSQLTERYRDMSDAELRRLARTPDDLTDIANEILKKEIAARKLTPGQPAVLPLAKNSENTEENEDDDIDGALWFSYAQKAPPHCTFEYDSIRQAQDAAEFLWESRIRSYVLQPNPDGMSLLGPRLVVLPKDAERATQILSQPIPNRIVDDPEIVLEDFLVPSCPICNTPDAILAACEPTNHWLCEACEHEWDDPAESELAE